MYMQAFYNTGKGELVINHRSDIWSGSVTMMNVLAGKAAKWEPHEQVCGQLSTLLMYVYTILIKLFTHCFHAMYN